MTEFDFSIADADRILSPGLVVFRQALEHNLDEMIRQSGNLARLRPHCKTHKMAAVIQMQLARGITKHKCATFAEAEMLARCGVTDILLAYHLVGPNIPRAMEFAAAFNSVQLLVIADHEKPINGLSEVFSQAGHALGVLLDLDSGQHRTGIPPGDNALALYRLIDRSPGLTAQGIHLYDGHNHQSAFADRQRAARACWGLADAFRSRLVAESLPVNRIVAGGTGTFPVYAKINDPVLECSPGTNTFFDAGYAALFPDLNYVPALRILTRVISRPADDTLTLDLGYKACASDPEPGQRLVFPDLNKTEVILQNEEHLVLRTPAAARFQPGDALLAIPGHVCPTSALHKEVQVIDQGRVCDTWTVSARDRRLSI